MKTDKPKVSRRKFIKATGLAAGAAAATIAAPAVVTAQSPKVLKMQPSWPASDIWMDFARQYIERVEKMANGRIKIDLLPAGSPFIAARELDLLVCLLRIAPWRHARAREDDTLAPLRQQLARCAFAVQAAELPLRQRSLSPVGLRLLDPAGWQRQR